MTKTSSPSHQYPVDDDVESRLPTRDNGGFVHAETADVSVGNDRTNSTCVIIGNAEKMTVPKKFVGLITIVCVLGIVIGLVIGLRGDRTIAQVPISISAIQQEKEMSSDVQVPLQTAAEVKPTTDVVRSSDGTSETNIPLSVGASETNIPLSGTSETNIPVFQQSQSLSPSARPTSSSSPSFHPSGILSASPTPGPSTEAPTSAPFLPLAYGQELSWTYADDLGIEVTSGISVKVIAQTGRSVVYGDGTESSHRYHFQMDGAGIVALPNGGYVYVSNSELEDGDGGVYGLYFDKDGRVEEYKPLLTGTSNNCGGGLSPWNTWISCEEVEGWGQCWQIDPDPSSENHSMPARTTLGGSGGAFESVAVDNSDPNEPIFFLTEDHEAGALRRFVADGDGWDSLHNGGTTTYLYFIDDQNFEWSSSIDDGRRSAQRFYPNSEGISYHDGMLYFVSKEMHNLYTLDLTRMTYQTEFTGGSQLLGRGSFNAQPDQIFIGVSKRYLYFTEDGGSSPGLFARDEGGAYYTVFQGIEGVYVEDETVGIAFTQDRKRLYAGLQDAGVLLELTRDDGMPFE